MYAKTHLVYSRNSETTIQRMRRLGIHDSHTDEICEKIEKLNVEIKTLREELKSHRLESR
jgi:hypothetical protein